MSSTLTIYTIKWEGPYHEADLPKDKNNMIYLWTGKTGPNQKENRPCYCGITGRGVLKRGRDKNHKKDSILVNTRKCWIGRISGGKRKVTTGYRNTAFERTEYLLIHFLKNYRRSCSLNEKKKTVPENPVGVYNIFANQCGNTRKKRLGDIRFLPHIILWNGEKVITDERNTPRKERKSIRKKNK